MFRTAVLVVHGFCGGLWENEYLVNYLQQFHNIDTYAYTLPGHEKDFLSKANYHDWINDTERHYLELTKKYKRIILIGHSMGGVICSYLASKYKVKKLILIAPAFEYLNFSKNKEDLKDIKSLVKEKSNYSLYKDFATKLIRYSPLVLNEFRKLVKENKDTVKNITCETLILHGSTDEIVPLSSSKYVYNNINSNNKYLTVINDARHRVFLNDKKDIICDYIYKFIKGGYIWKQIVKQEL